jgi:GntR family transcriptional repressor for pyruvate dehydrogenase complex
VNIGIPTALARRAVFAPVSRGFSAAAHFGKRRGIVEIRKINRKRIYEDIAEQLEGLLANSELKPGDKFHSEGELAAMFDVSRTTVRQALTVLETKGLIGRRQGAATCLAEQKPSDERKDAGPKSGSELLVTDLTRILSTVPKNILAEPMELRMIMEPNIASLAAKRASAEDIANLEDCLAGHAEAIRENRSPIDEDSAFHFALAKAANNRMLLVIVETLHALLHDSRYCSHKGAAASKSSLEAHVKILDAVKRKDAQGACDSMREHLLRVERRILLNNGDSPES